MNTLCIVGALFVVCCLFALIEPEQRTRQFTFLYALVGVFMVLIAGLRDGNTVGDYKVYLEMFHSPEAFPTIEPSFGLICNLTKALYPAPILMFLVYAGIGVSCKMYAINRLTPLLFLSLVIYISNQFILYDMIQIRAGAASGLFLLAIKPLADRKRLLYIGLVLLASFFHYSALLLLPLCVLNDKQITVKGRYFWWCIIPIGYLLSFISTDIISYIPIENIRTKLELYRQLQEQGEDGYAVANLFSPYFLFRCILYYYMLWKYDQISLHNRYFPLLIKIEGIALFLFPTLSFIPLLGYRASELLSLVEIVLYPQVIYTFRPSWMAKVVAIGIGLIFLMVNLFYRHLIIVR